MVRNLCCTVTIDSVLANSKKQNAFLFTVNAIFRHDYPLAVEPASTPRPLVQKTLGEFLSFRRVVLMSFLLGLSPASEYLIPTFRNTLSVPSSTGGEE